MVESVSLGRNGDSVHLLPRIMLLPMTVMRKGNEVDIRQPLQCGESFLNKYHSMPPRTESHGHTRPSQERQKDPREQVPVVAAPHWGYCTDFDASPLQSRGRGGGQVALIIYNTTEYDAHIIHEYTRQVESYMCKKARNAGKLGGHKLARIWESQVDRWVVTDCHTTGIREGMMRA